MHITEASHDQIFAQPFLPRRDVYKWTSPSWWVSPKGHRHALNGRQTHKAERMRCYYKRENLFSIIWPLFRKSLPLSPKRMWAQILSRFRLCRDHDVIDLVHCNPQMPISNQEKWSVDEKLKGFGNLTTKILTKPRQNVCSIKKILSKETLKMKTLSIFCFRSLSIVGSPTISEPWPGSCCAGHMTPETRKNTRTTWSHSQLARRCEH